VQRRRLALVGGVVGVLVLLGVAVSRLTGRSSTRPAVPATATGPRPGQAPVGNEAVPATVPRASERAALLKLSGYGLPVYCGGRSRPMVALTFDDGPGPYTHLVVAKLRKRGLRATFFLVGKQIKAYPGLDRYERGVAAVGDHTMTHPPLTALSQSAMVEEIAQAKALIEQTAGQSVELFRPPYGLHGPAIDREVRALGLVEVLWTVDSRDSLGADYAQIAHNVIAGLHPGSIILMHENRGQTVRALATILPALKRSHLTPVTLPTLLSADPPTLRQLRAGGIGCGKGTSVSTTGAS
jgi:peptidoglycan/xylan/chitin deacetylase (PgdA/CDA1 family)